MIKAILHALCLDHSPTKSLLLTCPCKLCAMANPDKITQEDYRAKRRRALQCGKKIGGRNVRCARAFTHEGKCLP